MTKFSKEIKIGLTVAVALFIFGWGINFLKGKDIFISGYKLHCVYSRIDGLTEASPVYYKGFKIGSVRKISLLSKGDSEILVTMLIEEGVEFPVNTIAQIYSLDFMGSKGIRFIYGDGNKMLTSGDTLKASVTGDLANQMSQEFLPLKDKVENMIVRFDSVFANINRVFDTGEEDGLVNNLKEITTHIKRATISVERNITQNGAISRSISNLDSLTMVLKKNGDILTSVMNNMDEFSSQLADTRVDSIAKGVNTVLASVNGVLKSMNEGEGTLGKLLSDEELYTNLNDVSISLDRLLNDVRVQPKRYVNFSAISFGSGKASKEKVEDRIYKVMLKKSKIPLDIRGRTVLDSIKINENREGKYYLYTIGYEEEYSNILELKNQIVNLYPDAEILEFKKEYSSTK